MFVKKQQKLRRRQQNPAKKFHNSRQRILEKELRGDERKNMARNVKMKPTKRKEKQSDFDGFQACDYLDLGEVGHRERSDFDCKPGDKFVFKVVPFLIAYRVIFNRSPLFSNKIKKYNGANQSCSSRKFFI